jgi:hypothetical protein
MPKDTGDAIAPPAARQQNAGGNFPTGASIHNFNG